MNREEVIEQLRNAIAQAGSQAAWARRHNLSRTAVHRALRGDKPLRPEVLRALGLKRVDWYVKDEGNK
jgi:DNA-binding phage protein